MTGLLASEYVDLFAGGAAGWEIAGRRLGLDFTGVELDADSCLTRDAAGLATIRGDVSELSPWKGIRGLVGSPPCQAWSRAGKRLGLEDRPHVYAAIDVIVSGRDTWQRLGKLRQRCQDPRSLLVVEPLRWALASYPEWVALEQVPDVLELWQRIGAELGRCGYHAWAGVLNSANYGVPQTRERAILIASRTRKVSAPAPTHSDQRRGGCGCGCVLGLLPWVSMADALGWHGQVGFPRRNDRDDDGEYRERDFRNADEPAFALTEKARSWRRIETNQVEWVTERDATPVTAREAAILQDLPPDWPFHGSKTSVFRQIGNCIPPGLAEAILREATGITSRSEAVA